MTNYPFVVPGHERIPFTFQVGEMGTYKILCDGKPMKRKMGKYKATLPNGEEIILGLKYSLDILNPKVTYKEHVIRVIPALPGYQMFFIYLPVVLVFTGGAIGGLFGGLAAYGNHSVFLGKAPVLVKILLSIGILFLAAIAYLIAAGIVHEAIQ